jgi:hypothetical protein
VSTVVNPELDESGEPRGVMRREEAPVAESSVGALVADSPGALLRLAVEKGMAVEQLEALVGLRERMEDRQARRDYFAALAAFQEEVGPVVRKRKADVETRSGGNMKYAYANVDDILTDVRPTLLKHGLSLKWDQKLDSGNCTTLCTVMHVGGHAETSSFTVPTESRAGMSPQQKVGAAMSYGQARVLGIALGITTTDQEPDAIDPTPISPEQLEEIQTACEKHEVPMERYLKALDVKSAGEIRRMDFMRALELIDEYVERKMKKAAKGGGQ